VLNNEVKPLGIKVTIIEPGAFRTNWATRTIPVSADYEQSVGAMIRSRSATDGRQPGDPARAAELIIGIARLDEPPLRLLLGAAALESAEKASRARGAEADEWAAVSRSADFGAGPPSEPFHGIDRLSGQRVRHQKVIEAPAPTPTLPRERGREIAARGEGALEPQPSLGQRGMGSYQQPRGSESVRPMPQSVSAGDVVKGFEVARDRYVTVDREELEDLAPERTRAIDVEQFVDAAAVDPVYFDVS